MHHAKGPRQNPPITQPGRRSVIMGLGGTLIAGWHRNANAGTPRYDDANEYLPTAERNNKTGLRLYLRQQNDEVLFKVETPRQVTVDVVSHIPQQAKFGVVFLLGGSGVLSIQNDKLDRSFSFQTRTRDLWWSHPAATFVIDAPSDRLGRDGIQDPLWRASADHLTDLKACIDNIAKRFEGPLIIHSHSNGAVSLANLAQAQHARIKAYVYGSASHYQRGTNLIYQVQHAAPVVFVQHRKDVCPSSPSHAFSTLETRVKAPHKQTLWIDGGVDSFSGHCGPFAPHSFVGVEKEAIEKTLSALDGLALN